MKHLARSFVLMTVFGLGVSVASAQVTTGTPSFGSFSGGPDVVNNANLNAHWAFPIIHKPGRGADFDYALSYDTSVWFPTGVSGSQNWNPAANWNWDTGAQGLTGYATYQLTNYTSTVIATCGGPGSSQEIRQDWTYGNFTYVDPNNAPHSFNGSATVTIYSGCSYSETDGFFSGPANDNSGYSFGFTANGQGGCLPSPCVVATASGTLFYPPVNGTFTTSTKTDSNGNKLSTTNGVFTDTLGQTALTIAGQAPNPVTLTYPYRKPDGTNGSAVYTVNYRTYTVRTGFACAGISEFGPLSRSLVDFIQLPNGKKYSFQYELTPDQVHYPGDVTARLLKVTLPTGGSISYAYTGAHDGVNCADGSTLNLTRTVSDGVTSNNWTYARTLVNGSIPATTTITAPQLPYDSASNQTVLSFDANNHETTRKIYQGNATGNPLRTVNTTWSGNAPATQVTILEDGLKQLETDTTYDSNGTLTLVSEYDWGSGSRGPLVRQTVNTLKSDPRIVNLVANQKVTDSGGIVKSRVDFAYDDPAHESTCRTTPVAGHDDGNFGCSFHDRGNRTSVTTYTDPVTPAGATTRYTSYDQLGNAVSADLSCCQQKTWSYSTVTDYAYPDLITRGSSSPTLTTSATYDLNLGLVVTSTDENGQISTFTYDSMGRVTDVKRPDNQHIAYTYDDTNLIVQASSPVQGTNQVVSKTYLDGLGRTIKTQLLDASNNSYSITETKYDTQGRAYKTSNPHNSTAQYWTETRFDAVGHVVKTILPDSGQSTAAYSLNTVTTTDPAGKQRKAQADGLGRMTAVFEPDVANGNTLTQQTSYTYDLRDNLTLVTQGAQTRSYIYDALGRLISSTTPEGGKLCFGTISGSTCNSDGYDSYNNLLKRTDARGVVTTYGYDTLNRPTSVSYIVTGATNVPATSTVTLTYGVDSSCNSSHGAGCIGRPITMTDGVGSENYTYNNLGQLTQVQKAIGSKTYPVGYVYNLAGELTQITYPSGRAVQQNVDVIGRLSSVVGTLNSVNTTYASGYAYSDAQQLKGFNYGNGINVAFGYSADRLQLNCLDYSSTNRNGTCAHDATTKFGLNYNYPASPGNNGQIAGITDSVDGGRSATYTYDALYRLTAAVTTGSTGYPKWSISETYDRYGNRSDQNQLIGNPPMNHVTIDPVHNRITGSPYGYDLSGNMTNDGLNTIIYDAENHVTSSSNGSSSGAYAYDGNGLRVKKCIPNCVSPTTTTIYIYSGHQVIAAYDPAAAVGSPTREYIYGGRQRVAKIEASSTVYYHHDHLSVRVTTDSSGNTITQKGHYPFGESWYQTGTASTDMVFTSYEHDSESGNDYALAREYVNRLGRFSALDPLSGNTSDPQSLNRYTYSRNDPIDLLDPEGEYDCSAGGCDFGGMGGYDCFIDGVNTNCGRIFGGGGFPGFGEFELAGIAATPTGSHWELAPCEGGVGCVHNWTEFEVFEYGNSGLLFFLAAGVSGNTSGGGGGGGGGGNGGPCDDFKYGPKAAWHIYDDHVAPGNEYYKSKYDVQDMNGFDSQDKKMGAVMALNDYVFNNSTPQVQTDSGGKVWSYVYTLNVPSGKIIPNPYYASSIRVNIVGTLAGNLGGGTTNDATLVLDPNCNVRTSFPGKPKTQTQTP
jgi:RHS repeat-associated protein